MIDQSSSRSTILKALGHLHGSPAPPATEPLPGAAERIALADDMLAGLWERFAEMLQALGGRMASLHDLWQLADRSIWIDADAIPLVGGSLAAHSKEPDIWAAEVGITTSILAVVETGSLVLASGPGRSRMASLAPPHHVSLVRRQAIVETLDEAFAQISARNTVLITGPSRTADIEGILIRGVHGPGELWVVVI